MQPRELNADPAEIGKFEDLAHQWWDATGEFKPLHEINPLRLDYIDLRARLKSKMVLDVGCGGGILAEAMARKGAQVTGIDLAEASLRAARRHMEASGLTIDYRLIAAEELAASEPQSFDVVTCMEMLEHVPDPAAVVDACSRLAKPGGHVFFSTVNRNPKSFLFAIVGAEYVLGLLPKGTHEFANFIRPSELSRWARDARLDVADLVGMSYNPFSRRYGLGRDVSVNYILHARKEQKE
jgi:2-polyprenyl-6-hydroxyphenyl methylase/3-demethylubiquinone-9 3-methyltransferase